MKYINIKKFCLEGKDITPCLNSLVYIYMRSSKPLDLS